MEVLKTITYLLIGKYCISSNNHRASNMPRPLISTALLNAPIEISASL